MKSWTRLSDFTFTFHFHFSLSCTGEGNGNPLQCSCLENPRDGGAWWAAVYGVAQSRTQLKRLSNATWEAWKSSLWGKLGPQVCRAPACGPLPCSSTKNLPVFFPEHLHPYVGKISWRREWQPTPVFLSGESQGWRSLVGCRLWGRTELDTTEVT